MHTSTSAGRIAPSAGEMPKRVAGKLRKLALSNPIAQRQAAIQRRRVLTHDFLASPRYDALMRRDWQPAVDGLNSAEWQTPNYRWRHFKRNHILGAWRWLGVYENSKFLLPLDFGGARGPISLEVAICDRLERDIFGRPVAHASLDAVPDEAFDFVWSSHTLEHIRALDDTLAALVDKLKPGGTLALLLPAYTCTRWRAGTHAYADGKGDSSHVHTFYLALDPNVPPELRADPAAVPIDVQVRRHAVIEQARMVGDNSIWIVARRE